jgi:hypothetical protein
MSIHVEVGIDVGRAGNQELSVNDLCREGGEVVTYQAITSF